MLSSLNPGLKLLFVGKLPKRSAGDLRDLLVSRARCGLMDARLGSQSGGWQHRFYDWLTGSNSGKLSYLLVWQVRFLRREEVILVSRFAEDYGRYRQRVPLLFPFLPPRQK